MAVLVGKKAPSFKAKAVVNGNELIENFSLDQYLGKKMVVFFFYPSDFAYVCPTEIMAFHEKIEEFEERNVAVVGCSVDSELVHHRWLQTAQSEGGIKGVKFPLVADSSKTIAENYHVLAGSYEYNEDGQATFNGLPVAYRGLFLIDKQGIIRHQLVNDIPMGRSILETLRLIDALQYYEENGEVCPAEWHKGDKGMKNTQEGVLEYFSNK